MNKYFFIIIFTTTKLVAMQTYQCGPIQVMTPALKLEEALLSKNLKRVKKYETKHPRILADTFLNSITYNRLDNVQAFLAAGIDPNGTYVDGYFPLFVATKNDCPETVRLLIGYGAYLNRQVCYGNCNTSLVEAVRRHYTAIVRLLLACGADPNIVLKDGKTALVYAVRQGYEAAVVLLLEYGADTTLQDSSGKNALNYIKPQTSYSVMHILKQATKKYKIR